MNPYLRAEADKRQSGLWLDQFAEVEKLREDGVLLRNFVDIYT
jgi:hypothetical protein